MIPNTTVRKSDENPTEVKISVHLATVGTRGNRKLGPLISVSVSQLRIVQV
ncbi:hypothetical protein HYC85_014792 [Camellia sinensis]|uniref:Uncharacterized protein n=1 Tax=Camellia sinensis TaxID=4442 RepID=A0A7J7H8D7_CAMSI|nr:hypothetical protein HYC85_014792 [Camellia sinensis]